MKTITRSKIYLPIAAMILSAALAVPAAAQKQVPIKGTMQAHDTDTAFPTPTTVVVVGVGGGIASHLGQFSLTYQITVDFTNGAVIGTATLIAANGDSVFATIAGSGETTSTPDVVSITETYTITGGTGRYVGAKGSFILERLANVVTFNTAGSFNGTITSPGATH